MFNIFEILHFEILRRKCDMFLIKVNYNFTKGLTLNLNIQTYTSDRVGTWGTDSQFWEVLLELSGGRERILTETAFQKIEALIFILLTIFFSTILLSNVL